MCKWNTKGHTLLRREFTQVLRGREDPLALSLYGSPFAVIIDGSSFASFGEALLDGLGSC